MESEQYEARAWDVIEKVGNCMMVTQFNGDGALRGRPMEARPDREEGVIWFLTDVRAAKDEEIAAWPDLCLVFIDPDEKVYLSVSGRAEVIDDHGRTRALWNERQQAWWPGGPDDPNVRVVCVVPELIEFWDGPANPAEARRQFRRAQATGEKPNLGERRKKAVEVR
jgi:general stress protein 26